MTKQTDAFAPTIEEKVIVYVRSVYGNELMYPANLDAELFARLTKKKTLDLNDLRIIKELGYTIEALSASPALTKQIATL